MTNLEHLLGHAAGGGTASRRVQRLGATYAAGINVNYRWSRYRHNAIHLGDYPIRPHAGWLLLGCDSAGRRATGSERFRCEIETALARSKGSGRRGRPKKGP